MIPWLNPASKPLFPPTSAALGEPNGLLAAGGSLEPEWLLEAYRRGIFPWFSDDEPILWWSPAPRMVLYPEEFHASRSLRKFLRRQPYRITRNRRFGDVMQACSEPRPGQPRSWINTPMLRAYARLNALGHAESWECWDRDYRLVGGLYGVSMGSVFFGESMFSRADNASKACLLALARDGGYRLIDCQMHTEHLASLGAREIPRREFESALRSLVDLPRANPGSSDA
jgi:leucyl/phenylalanyl-tRNA--protein transferase